MRWRKAGGGMTRARHDPAFLASRADMLADCLAGDEFACRYLIAHDAPEQPDEPRPIATVIAGAFVIVLLVAGFLNIPIWSN